MPTLAARTRLVLHHPFFPENIGAAARAMRNTGLQDLRVVQGASPSHHRAVALAVRAGDLLAATRVEPDLAAALAGTTLVVGTSSRPLGDARLWTPREAAAFAATHPGPVALVFGNEKNGLAKRELRRCDVIVRIPCVAAEASLNLAQAAMILCYEWLLADLAGGPPDPLLGWPALAAEPAIAALAEQAADALTALGFFKAPKGPGRAAGLRQVLARMRLTPGEAALLRAAAHKASLAAVPPRDDAPPGLARDDASQRGSSGPGGTAG